MPPMPKRSEQRRRANKVPGLTRTEAGSVARAPAAVKDWHPAAKRWYQSLRRSGQSRFYEASDWAEAHMLAEMISRELLSGELPRASVMAAFLNGATNLLTTEGARRRLHMELVRSHGESEADSSTQVVRGIFDRLAGSQA